MGSEEVMGIQWVKGRGTSAEGQGLHKPWGGQQGGEEGGPEASRCMGVEATGTLGGCRTSMMAGRGRGARCPSVLAHRCSAELQASDVWGK